MSYLPVCPVLAFENSIKDLGRIIIAPQAQLEESANDRGEAGGAL